HGTQSQQLINGTGDGIGAIGHQVGEAARLDGATSPTFPVELSASCRVQLHGCILINRLVWSLNTDLLRPAGHHAPDRLHRVIRSRWRIATGRDLHSGLHPAADREDLVGTLATPSCQELRSLLVEKRLLHSNAHS